MLDSSINLVACFFAMSVGPLPHEIPAQLPVPWSDGCFQSAVHSPFNSPPDSDFENVIFGTEICARNIERAARIQIIWTDNMADHLHLADGDKKLCVFHQASFLKHQKDVQSLIYPPGLVEETLNTLALLFPTSDRKTKVWLEEELRTDDRETRVDLGLFHVGNFKAGHSARRLESYHFWRDRLGILKDAVDEATPSKALLKALSDRKRGDRWLNS